MADTVERFSNRYSTRCVITGDRCGRVRRISATELVASFAVRDDITRSYATAQFVLEMWWMLVRVLSATVLLLVIGCSDGRSNPTEDCADEKCDLPEDAPEQACERGRTEAFNPNRQAYTNDALRWSCADVPGVTGDHQGQEYCEYFAMVELPRLAGTPSEIHTPGREHAGSSRLQVLGRNLGDDAGTTPVSLDLRTEHIDLLSVEPSAVVGQCIFTSWNADVPAGIPACNGLGCDELYGVRADNEDMFRMKFVANSEEAAMILIDDCFVSPEHSSVFSWPTDDFVRGCMINSVLNGTSYRKSDSITCAAAMRLSECGCDVDEFVVEMLANVGGRGFALGSWQSSYELPPKCRYVDTKGNTNTLVACDISAGQALDWAADPKGFCREEYADNVVVHVPVYPEEIDCFFDSLSDFAYTCTDTPWIVEPK